MYAREVTIRDFKCSFSISQMTETCYCDFMKIVDFFIYKDIINSQLCICVMSEYFFFPFQINLCAMLICK